MLRRVATLDWRTPLAFVLPLGLYLLTLAPTIYNLDSAELTTAAATGGITRATGYPLYLLLGRLWSQLPIGDVGYRMNLFSAVSGALTIVLVERILRRLQVGRWATFGALGLLACTTYFWALSLIAEVYTLQTVLMAAIILLLLRWAEQPTPQRLAAVGLVGGLSLGHHVMTTLLVPGCVWYVATVAPRRAFAPRSLLYTLGALLVGLSVYLYLPWQFGTTPAFNYAGHYDATGTFQPVNLRTLDGLWWLVSGRAFAGQMFAYRGLELWHEVLRFGTHLWRAFFAIGIGPGLLGMVLLLRRNWRLGSMLLLLFVGHAAFYIDYRVGDKALMFLPTYLVWAVWIGVGYQWLLSWLHDAGEATARHWSLWLLRGLLVGAVLMVLSWNWQLVDQSDDRSTRVLGETMLTEVEPNALILGFWATVPPIEYLQLVEHQRPDVKAINRFLISHDNMRRLILAEVARRPVYIDNVAPDLLNELAVRQEGSLYRLFPCGGLPGSHGSDSDCVAPTK